MRLPIIYIFMDVYGGILTHRRNRIQIKIKSMHSEKHSDDNLWVLVVFKVAVSTIRDMHCFKLFTIF